MRAWVDVKFNFSLASLLERESSIQIILFCCQVVLLWVWRSCGDSFMKNQQRCFESHRLKVSRITWEKSNIENNLIIVLFKVHLHQQLGMFFTEVLLLASNFSHKNKSNNFASENNIFFSLSYFLFLKSEQYNSKCHDYVHFLLAKALRYILIH